MNEKELNWRWDVPEILLDKNYYNQDEYETLFAKYIHQAHEQISLENVYSWMDSLGSLFGYGNMLDLDIESLRLICFYKNKAILPKGVEYIDALRKSESFFEKHICWFTLEDFIRKRDNYIRIIETQVQVQQIAKRYPDYRAKEYTPIEGVKQKHWEVTKILKNWLNILRDNIDWLVKCIGKFQGIIEDAWRKASNSTLLKWDLHRTIKDCFDNDKDITRYVSVLYSQLENVDSLKQFIIEYIEGIDGSILQTAFERWDIKPALDYIYWDLLWESDEVINKSLPPLPDTMVLYLPLLGEYTFPESDIKYTDLYFRHKVYADTFMNIIKEALHARFFAYVRKMEKRG